MVFVERADAEAPSQPVDLQQRAALARHAVAAAAPRPHVVDARIDAAQREPQAQPRVSQRVGGAERAVGGEREPLDGVKARHAVDRSRVTRALERRALVPAERPAKRREHARRQRETRRQRHREPQRRAHQHIGQRGTTDVGARGPGRVRFVAGLSRSGVRHAANPEQAVGK